MLAQVISGTVVGLDGIMIEVQVDVANRGFPTFTIVGLPDKAVDEAKDRVRTAIINAGFEMPDSRITVNLAPADIPKNGSSFDLPIAVGILAAAGMVKPDVLRNSLFAGELSLEGKIRRIPGMVSIAMLSQKHQIQNYYIPSENCEEAGMIEGINIYPLTDIQSLILHLNAHTAIPVYIPAPFIDDHNDEEYEIDFSEIKGQEQAKRAMEIASAGFHNLHLKGPPGVGKTMLSRAFASILPPLSPQETVDVCRIYSAIGSNRDRHALRRRPFRAPHHTTSRIGLIGGGSHPIPGEISLAHKGVLFLDELPEFPRSVLESLRQPLEDGIVTISRAAASMQFPCRFLLLAASNPCPYGLT